MEYKIEIDNKNKMIILKSVGVSEYNTIKQIINDAAAEFKKTGHKKFFCDVKNNALDISKEEAANITGLMKIAGIDSSIKIAILYKLSEKHRKSFQELALNSGFNLKYFKEKNKALKWLKNK